MKKICLVSMLSMFVMLALNTGCLSVWSESSSRKELTLKKAVLSNNQRAIQAVRLGDNGVGFGIDISNLEALTYHPVRQIGAAIGDAALLYGAYEGVRSFTDNSSNSSDTDVGRDNITVKGDGNTVNVGNTKTDNTAPAPAAE